MSAPQRSGEIPSDAENLLGVIELSKYLGAGGSAADAAPLPGLYEAKKGVKVRLSFKIWYLSDFGETLWISGNHPALGSWIPQNGLQVRHAHME